jgi:predicted RNase H-like HicB family nuclease
MKVEGYEVDITRVEDKFMVSVPELPGCSVQVDDKKDAKNAIREMIGLYLTELASKRPKHKKNDNGPAGDAKKGPSRMKK